MSSLSKNVQQKWTAEQVKQKLGDQYSIADIQKALNDIGGISSDEELQSLKVLLPVVVPTDRLAVSRTPAPTAGLAVKPQSGMTRKQRRSPSKNSVQPPQPINLSPVETVEINLPQAVHSESLLDRQIDEFEAQQMLALGLQQVGETAKTIVQVRQTLNEAQLRISLSLSGLSNEGTYDECLQRWNNYVLEQQQEIAEIESATLQLAQQNNSFLQSLGMAV